MGYGYRGASEVAKIRIQNNIKQVKWTKLELGE